MGVLVFNKTALLATAGLLSYGCLVTLPLGRHHVLHPVHTGAGGRELGSELSEHVLVDAHASGEGGEVVQLVGQTNRAAIDVNIVALLARDLVDLEHTLGEHGSLEAVHEVLAETHGPVGTHSLAGLGVLVDQTVNSSDRVLHLDLTGSEDRAKGGATHAQAHGLGSLHSTIEGNSAEEVTNGGQVAAVLASSVVGHLVGGSNRVGLEGQVVVGDLVALASHDLENLVSSLVQGRGELDTKDAHSGLKVGLQALLDGIGAGLTSGDGLHKTLVEIGTHHLSLGTDVGTVGLVGLLNLVHDTSEPGHRTGVLLVVGSDQVGQSGHLGRKVALGTTQVVGRCDGSSSGGLAELLRVLHVLLLHVSHGAIQLLGGSRQVTGHVAGVAGVALAKLLDLEEEVLLEGSHLGGRLLLEGIHLLLEATTGTLGSRPAAIGDLVDLLELTFYTGVDQDLGRLHGADLTCDDLDLGHNALVHTLGFSDNTEHASGELLAELLHLVGSILAGLLDVLHRCAEVGCIECSLLGERPVEVGGGSSKLEVESTALVGELLVGLTEHVVGLLLSLLERRSEVGQGLLLGSLVLALELLELQGSTTLLVPDAGLGGQLLRLQLLAVVLGDLLHAGRLVVDTVLKLLHLVASLLSEGVVGLLGSEHSIGDLTLDLLGVDGDLAVHLLALASRVLVGSSSLRSESLHLLNRTTHGGVEVVLGDFSSRLGGVVHLLLEVLAGLSRLEGEGVDLFGGLLLETSDLLGEALVGQPGSVLVHLLSTLLNELGTLLTLGDGVLDGERELLLVALLDDAKLLAASSRLLGVLLDDTSELEDLLLSDAVVLGHSLSEGRDLGTESLLGAENSIHGVETHATSGSREGMVLLALGSLLGGELSVQTSSRLLEAALGVLAVAGECGPDLAEGTIERRGHAVHLASGLSLTLVDETLKLGISLEVLLVTVVSELDHALHLCGDSIVDLGLGSTVGAHDTSSLVETVVQLGVLVLSRGTEGQQANPELGGGLANLSLGFRASSIDVTHSLGIAFVLERLLGVQGSLHTHDSSLQGHVDLVTVLGHLGLDTVELGTSLGDHGVDLVGSPNWCPVQPCRDQDGQEPSRGRHGPEGCCHAYGGFPERPEGARGQTLCPDCA